MPTSTNVTNLKINTLTEAQYDTAVQGGVIGENELSIITDLDTTIQVSTMPTASATEDGNIYQYIGTTDANYTNGYFYKCVSDGQTPATYSWSNVQVQASSGGLPSQIGNSGKFLTTDGTDASWSDKPLVNTATGTGLGVGTGSSAPYTGNCAIGINALADGAMGGTCLGTSAQAGAFSVAIGYNTHANVSASVAIGQAITTTTSNTIQINASTTSVTNSDSNTFKVANANGNYELMSADGTIPAARHASLPAADGTYVLKLVISGGVPTLSWVAE